MAATSIFASRAINSPKHAPDREETHFSEICLLPSCSLYFFLSPKHQKTPKNTPKNTSKSLDSFLFTKNTRYCFCTQSSFPWFYIQDLWFRGLDLHAQGFYAMFCAQIYVLTCLYVQINMLRVLCHVSFVSFLPLLCIDFRVMCSCS